MEYLIKFGQMSLDSYQGETAQQPRNGFGLQKFKSGYVYTGNWKNDRPHGYGRLVLKDVISYEGWSNCAFH